MAKNRKTYDDDDGRTVADMNVDGMPLSLGGVLKNIGKKEERSPSEQDFSDLSGKDTWEIIKGSVKAGLLIGGIFVLGCLVFILFCLFVWFR